MAATVLAPGARVENPAFHARGDWSSTEQRNGIWRGILHPRPWSSPYERLKLAMDYWCALWFWPIEKADLLPTRDQFLFELSTILEGTIQGAELMRPDQGALFDDGAPHQEQLQILDDHGQVDLEELVKPSERLKLVREVAERHRFLHWELEFADVFADRGGFDLILGNPPWIKVEWNEGDVMGDFEPIFTLREPEHSAKQLEDLRDGALKKHSDLRPTYLTEYVDATATQQFLNACANYPLLVGSQSNTFKSFISIAIHAANQAGVFGYVHDDGMFNDPGGGRLRRAIYERLRLVLQFENELNLFPGLNDHGRMRFEVTVCGSPTMPEFWAMSDVFWPTTVDESFAHDGSGPVEGRKDIKGKWNKRGHLHRLLKIDETALNAFAEAYDPPGTLAVEARLPQLQSRELLEVVAKFAAYRNRLGVYRANYKPTVMWDESAATVIGPANEFATEAFNLIFSGPHITVANPSSKTPRSKCTASSHYDVLDLTELPAAYLPRTLFKPSCPPESYVVRVPRVPWDQEKPVTEYFRLASRTMLNQVSERTLHSAIIPRDAGHIDGCFSLAFKDPGVLLACASGFASLPFDFFIKTTGKNHFRNDLAKLLPVLETTSLLCRAAVTNCLTSHYATLWRECFDPAFASDLWAKADPRLSNERFSSLRTEWQWSTPLRTDYERREALVEIDVLAAMELRLTLDELCTIYRIQFPILRQNEQDTWYDRNGRIVFTCSKALPAVGFTRPEWEQIRAMQSGTVSREIEDDTLPGGPRQRVITYATADVNEVAGVARMLGGAAFALARIAPRRYERLADAGAATGVIDPLLVRAYLRAGAALPPHQAGDGTPHSGAALHLFAAGVAQRVVKADVASLYPSLMRAYRIGPSRDRLGALLALVDRLVDLRLAAKARAREAAPESAERYGQEAMSAAMKLVVNSAYGYLAAGGLTRFADVHAANEVTRRGRETLELMCRELAGRGVTLLEADTDGVYFAAPEGWSEADERRVVAEVARLLPPRVQLEFEGRYAAMLSHEPKNYALLRYDGSIILHGVAFRSSRAEPFGEAFLRKAITHVLVGDVVGVREAYLAALDRLRRRELTPRDVSSRVRLTKTPAEYFAVRQNRRELPYEAMLASGRTSWSVGDRVRVYRKRNGGSGLLEESEDGPAGTSNTNERDYDIDHYARQLRQTFASRLACAFKPADYETVFADPDQMSLFMPAIGTIRTVLEKKVVANADAF